MLRGGSFNNTENNVRCAARNRNNPNNRNDNNGFRVIAAHILQGAHSRLPELPAGYALPDEEKNGRVCSRPHLEVTGRANSNAPVPSASCPGTGAPLDSSCTTNSARGTIYSWPIDGLPRASGGHANVAAFEYRLEDHLLALLDELTTQSYVPRPYTSFYIHEPKRRLISAAPFRDRVIHHALCNIIEPLFERSFTDDSFANRVGKGTHRALERVQKLVRRHRYALQCDVVQFFPSVDHEVLRRTLARKIDDERVLWLCDRILASGVGVLSEEYEMVYFPGDDLFAVNRPRGLPIGNLTSQFWANCHMNPFDHFVKRRLRCPGYVRYVDDVVLFADDKRTLWGWLDAVKEKLGAMRLTIHPSAHPRPTTEGIPFLGFVVYPDRRRLKRRKGLYYRRRFIRLLDQYAAGEIDLETLNDSVCGWVNHVRYGNTVGLREALFAAHPVPLRRSAQTKDQGSPRPDAQHSRHTLPLKDSPR